jgi:hypothetical protein
MVGRSWTELLRQPRLRMSRAKEGVMADKTTQLVLDALSRAVADPGGLPLHGNKKIPGLFATGAAAKQIARRCKDEGYLRVVRSETKGKSHQETCAITEKGLAYLLSQVSPKQVLEELVQTLQARQVQVGELVEAARQWQAGLDALQATVERVLQQIHQPGASGLSAGVPGPTPSPNGSDAWLTEAVACLTEWQASRASEDCPLPDLYRRARGVAPHLSIGHFHDGLRRLHDQQQIYLHPWTGPLYEIPEPPYALLVGHEVAYYASPRKESLVLSL